MITNKVPVDWKDLQTQVALILEQSGLEVEVEKKIQSVRGVVEIDVYAKERIEKRDYLILVECKHWKERIPQTIIHAFRTVINDVGANIGYIISIHGFQSGSYNVSSSTNLSLVTWETFLTLFEKVWLRNYFLKYIEDNFREIIYYTEPLVPTWALSLRGTDKVTMKELRQKNEWLGWLLLDLLNSFGIIVRDSEFLGLPLNPKYKSFCMPDELFKVGNYVDLIDCLQKYATPALKEFGLLKEKALQKEQ
ncbi:MAG: restriction endonuclease [Bacillota bacterium]|nr:restriction endonuclease [Bacillota bacterium]